MIEQGLVMLVQADAAVQALCPVGGFYASLPEDQPLPCWSYLRVSLVPNWTLRGRNQQAESRWQLDIYGTSDAKGADCITIAKAIRNVLDGYKGTLPDPDGTVVQLAYQSDLTDFFDDTARTYRRMLEFVVIFNDVS